MCIYTVKKQKINKNKMKKLNKGGEWQRGYKRATKGATNGKRHYIVPVCNMTCFNLC